MPRYLRADPAQWVVSVRDNLEWRWPRGTNKALGLIKSMNPALSYLDKEGDQNGNLFRGIPWNDVAA